MTSDLRARTTYLRISILGILAAITACNPQPKTQHGEPDVSDVEYTITDSSEGSWRDMEREALGDSAQTDDSLKAELRRLFRQKHGL